MVLDDTGVSPWGWKQNSLISVNPKTLEIKYHPEFYLMKHLARYILHGASRLVLAEADDDILAFVNPDGKETIIAINRRDIPKEIVINKADKYLTITLQPKSFNTLYY
jgi:glucosylceramidase